ncbi:MAG: AtzE family amidohydrolase [Actinomycetia bacterium]|nr:AtzE family amidohydrolase [Actinomycetes bacterium]
MSSDATALEIRDAVSSGAVTATEVTEASLDRIKRSQGQLNAFTTITHDRAVAVAAAIDDQIRNGEPVGPLAGVPFAAKDLFDLEGITTRAGSDVLTDQKAATEDAAAVAALIEAGGIPVGALTMDEFAFGFTTENTHVGPAHNPHDLTRTPGGSSGGSGAAVAGGLVPIALGTDTNGSVRVPASLCGLFAIKPTYGRISRAGVQLFSDSLDHVGLFARSADDLRGGFEALERAGPDGDPILQPSHPEPGQLRVGCLGGWFADNAGPEAREAVDLVAEHLGVTAPPAQLERAGAAHAAASVITYAEAGELHLDRIRHHRHRFDPVVRHRLVAAALLPADWYVRAQRVRGVWASEVGALFDRFDVLLAPATPFVAPAIGTETVVIAGEELPARPALGWLTQPLTPTGLPIGVAPTWPGDGRLPLGVQIIAPAGHEERILNLLAELEAAGVTRSPVAPPDSLRRHP